MRTTIRFSLPGSGIDSLEIDATVSNTAEYSAEATSHRVETGGRISDHVNVRAPKLSLSGVISSTPLGQEPDPDRPLAAQELLETLLSNAVLLEVQIGAKVYTDLVLETVSVPSDQSTGESIRFSLSFAKFRFVTAQTTRALRRQPRRQVAPVATPEQANAAQAAVEPVVEPLRSTLASWQR